MYNLEQDPTAYHDADDDYRVEKPDHIILLRNLNSSFIYSSCDLFKYYDQRLNKDYKSALQSCVTDGLGSKAMIRVMKLF